MAATFIKSVTFDCTDALVVARFWAAALGSTVEETSTSAKAFVEAPGWGGPSLWFARVPEGKRGEPRTDPGNSWISIPADPVMVLMGRRWN